MDIITEFCRAILKLLQKKKINKNKNENGVGIFTKEELEYGECEQFLPLRHGDVVYCIRAYDGDTCTLAWTDHSGNKVRSSCRINGIDTPELRGSSPQEKALALEAKQRLEDAIVGNFVTILQPATEKYGRVLCDFKVGDIESVRDHMLAAPSICKPYDGGKKTSWD